MKFVVLLLAAVLAAPASAANAPDPRLDAVASQIAGHAVTVWCETDQDAWNRMGAPNFGGYVIPGHPVAYLAPRICLTLRYFLGDPPPASWNEQEGIALFGLLHESEHLAGIVDEHEADCRALSIVHQYAISLLGIPEQVTNHSVVNKLVYGWKYVKRHGRRIRVRTHKIVYQTITWVSSNPVLDVLEASVIRYHLDEPPPYAGAC